MKSHEVLKLKYAGGFSLINNLIIALVYVLACAIDYLFLYYHAAVFRSDINTMSRVSFFSGQTHVNNT